MFGKILSYILYFGLIIMALSGIVMYFMPRIDVAGWAHWTLLGISATRWQWLHMGVGLLVVLAGAVKLAVSGLKLTKDPEDTLSIRAAFAGLVIVLGCSVAAIAGIWPLSSVQTFHNSLLEAHDLTHGLPPFPGAQKTSLRHFAQLYSLDLTKVMSALEHRNIKVTSPDQTLLEIAEQNDVAPVGVYEAFRYLSTTSKPEEETIKVAPSDAMPESKESQKTETTGPPSLPDSLPVEDHALTLQDFCEKYTLPLGEATAALHAKGIRAVKEFTLAEIAQANDVSAADVYAALRDRETTAPATTSEAEQTAPEDSPVQAVPVPPNLGKMLIASYCYSNGINLKTALERLREKRIMAFADMTFQEIALENNLKPEEILAIITAQNMSVPNSTGQAAPGQGAPSPEIPAQEAPARP